MSFSALPTACSTRTAAAPLVPARASISSRALLGVLNCGPTGFNAGSLTGPPPAGGEPSAGLTVLTDGGAASDAAAPGAVTFGDGSTLARGRADAAGAVGGTIAGALAWPGAAGPGGLAPGAAGVPAGGAGRRLVTSGLGTSLRFRVLAVAP